MYVRYTHMLTLTCVLLKNTSRSVGRRAHICGVKTRSKGFGWRVTQQIHVHNMIFVRVCNNDIIANTIVRRPVRCIWYARVYRTRIVRSILCTCNKNPFLLVTHQASGVVVPKKCVEILKIHWRWWSTRIRSRPKCYYILIIITILIITL
jgi:hypothetical protein